MKTATEVQQGPAGSVLSHIDCDVHEALRALSDLEPYLPHQWKRFVTEVGWRGPSAPGLYASVHNAGTNLRSARVDDGPAGSNLEAVREQLLDRYPGSVIILTSLFFPSDIRRQPEMNNAMASAYNDWLVDHWLSRDKRILGSICTPPEPAAAVAEIDRMAKVEQMVQVMLPVVSWEWGHPSYHPIFEAAQRHGLVVTLHTSGATPGGLSEFRYYSSYRTCYPHAYQAQLVGLINNGVFAKCPELKLLLLEGGFTWLPHLKWRGDRTWRAARRETPWVTEPPSRILTRNVWFGTQPMEEPDDPQDMLKMIEIAELESKLVFSTDYPHWDFDEPGHMLPAFPAGLRRRIMVDNALDLYGDRFPKTLLT